MKQKKDCERFSVPFCALLAAFIACLNDLLLAESMEKRLL
jgi:hypothetical protein